MNNTHLTFVLIGAIVLAGGSFYGGTLYQKSQTVLRATQENQGANLANGRGAFRGVQGRTPGGAGIGFIGGEIISKETNSLTLKLTADSGSKIVFFSTSTQIGKMAPGTTDDLTPGETVSVNGLTNADGSMTASMIQIRPQPAARMNNNSPTMATTTPQ